MSVVIKQLYTLFLKKDKDEKDYVYLLYVA